MFAQDLTSTEKVVLCILIDKYLTMKAFNNLQPDGSFYITGRELESKMDIKKDQILKKYIPRLECKGFINKISRPADKEGVYKTYCYFTLNWGTILNHKGDKKNEAVQAKRAAKAEKIKTRQIEQVEVIEQYPIVEAVCNDYDGGYDDYLLYSEIMQQEERLKQAEHQQEEADRSERHTGQQQHFNIGDLMIQDDFEDAATIDIKHNGYMYDAGEQWAGFI
ncbi:MAG: hypothetical protein J5382_09580 [Bacteroidales bacterium]|nr:hypothetical protein [Bacteroidales bacterium]